MRHLKKSRFTIEFPIQTDSEKLTAIYHTLTRSFILMAEADWLKVIQRKSIRQEKKTINMLRDQGFLANDNIDETAVYDCWKQQQVHDFTVISSKVNVTRKCNNRCRYCILDPQSKEMSPSIAWAMDRFYIDMIKEKRPLSVNDDYLGGEPLLNSAVILLSAGRRFNFCRKNNIEYGFTITTNGTLLTPEIVKKMKKSGLTGIRVSLAGPAEIHDKLRPSAGNRKTYHTIIENLRSVSGLIRITIECQYDSGSGDYQRVPEMFDDFKKNDIDITAIHFAPIMKKRGKSRFNSGTGDPQIALTLNREARQHGLVQALESPSSLCRAEFRSMFVFDTDGSMIPCPSFREGEMAYGHVLRGVDFVAESQLLNRRLPDKCRNLCAFLPICNGGCRQQALVYTGDFAGIDCQYETLSIFLDAYIKEKAEEVLNHKKGEYSAIAA